MIFLTKFLKHLKNSITFFIPLGLRGYLSWLPDEVYLKCMFRCKMGYWFDLKNPKTFNEKLQWLKLHDRNPLYTQLVDKYEVRKYISETIGEEYLVPLLGIWDKFDDIDFDKLPNQFVLKSTHDSGGLVICTDKSNLDISIAKKKINKCLRKNCFYLMREWPYKNIKPRIVAEQWMVDESGIELKDYKIFCFNGEPKFLLVATDRRIHQTKFDFFDLDFNHLPFMQHYSNNTSKIIQKPSGLPVMLNLANKLTKNFAHCRADFYDINGRVYFGELTFCHLSGLEPFEPKEWDEKFGEFLKL